MAGEKILLIEDDKELQEIITGFWKKEGYQVTQAFDGEEGIHLAKETAPALILLDLMLPKADGFEVCRLIQMNQLSIHKQEVYADEFFEKLFQEYRQDALQQNYDFRYICPPKVLIMIDPDRITQVVQNIVSNAVKYGGNHLEIVAECEVLEQERKLLIVSIRDNGKGIAATDLPFVFDLFYRGNKARNQNIPGSGIGLNISKSIVEQHGGTIECDSVMGGGTTVSFSIPLI